jgi:hypothetical protein
MIVAESRRGRRIVGRLDRGRDLFEGLLAVCRERGVRCGELRALGSLERVEVAEYDQDQKVWKRGRTFTAGGLELLNLTGNISERDGGLTLHAHATLMRDRDNGVEIIGGHLVSASVFALEFVIEAYDDLLLRRATDPATGLTLWNEAIPLGGGPDERPAAPPARAAHPAEPEREETRPIRMEPPRPLKTASAPSSVSPTWSQVAEASAAKPAPAATDDEVEDAVSPGDVILHPTFGRCEVQRIEGAYEFAHVRLRNGRLVRLSLDVIKLSPAGKESDHRIYRARVDG